MKAIILAAGIGTRLGGLSKNTPKCLIKLGGKTILEQNISSLRESGLQEEDILLVLGKEGEMWTEENYQKIKKIHPNIIINEKNVEKNQAYSFWIGVQNIKESIVCIDGDTLFDKAVLKELISSEYPSCFVTKEDISSDRFRRVIVQNGKVLGIGKELNSNRRYMPILKFGTDFLFALKKELCSKPEIYFNNSIEIAINEICNECPIYNLDLENMGKEVNSLVMNINTPEEYSSAVRTLKSKRNFVVFMQGYTAVGKSTTAQKIATLQNTDIYHSAVVRKELDLTPTNPEDADKFFDYNNNLREEVDKKVYSALAEKAKESLMKGNNVVLDAGYFFGWQRKLVYDVVKEAYADLIVVRVKCDDENEIKRRLDERMKNFSDSPLNETPSWNTYLATKQVTEDIEKDDWGEIKVKILEYDTLKNKIILKTCLKNIGSILEVLK